MPRNTKIVATLGPSSNSEEVIRALILAGMDVARLNFSHGTHAEHANRISILRHLSRELGRPITVLQDLQGPKIRVGELPVPITLVPDQQVLLVSILPGATIPQGSPGDPTIIPMDFLELASCAQPGGIILLDDGLMELCVTQIEPQGVLARVIQGGVLTSHKGVNLPGTVLPIPGFTAKDREDLAFGLAQGVDAVAASFVRTPEDIDVIRQAILKLAPERTDTHIVAKLERPEALENLDAILERADGVMVARGDLGVEMPPATVPIAQKRIIQTATQHMKFVITATQMLESMIQNPRPTRAEASDVANAVFDGTDAVMLSAETASGAFPVESIAMMDAIVHHAEDHYSEWGHCEPPLNEEVDNDAVSMTRAARELAHDRNVAAIVVFTRTGKTTLLMSKMRPRVPILGFTPIERTYSGMGFYWGVTPYMVPYASTVEEMIEIVEKVLLSSTFVKPGQQVVLISGFPFSTFPRPNLALLHTVGMQEK
ncbi:MAG: pyruvate kinase [Anaerolineaceae bacterium]|nr:pyruvate kinase [Anaerolineaceae bacterium]